MVIQKQYVNGKLVLVTTKKNAYLNFRKGCPNEPLPSYLKVQRYVVDLREGKLYRVYNSKKTDAVIKKLLEAGNG